MSFDVTVAHEATCTRVSLRGAAAAGRLLSLLKVLEVDCAAWPRDAALLDLRALQVRLSPDEQWCFAWEAARALRRMKKAAVLAGPGRMRDAGGVRAFEAEHEALRWLAA